MSVYLLDQTFVLSAVISMRKTIAVFLIAALAVPIRHGNAAERLNFPASGFSPGWKSESIRRMDTSADLFTYLDGGAELYLEYFFDKLYVCEYRHPDLGVLTLEAYRFHNPEDAWGIFSLDTTGVPWSVGRESRGPDSTGSGVLRCWQGRYLIRAFAWSPSPAVSAVMKQATQMLTDGIADAPLPAWLSNLHKSGRAAFLRGEIALRQIAGSSAPRDIPFERERGAVWIPPQPPLIKSPALILRCSDEEDAARKFHRLWSKITAEAQNFVLTEKRGLAELQNNTTTGIEPVGDYLIWIPNAADEKSCADALDALRRILGSERSE
jgi:hypothetical protein